MRHLAYITAAFMITFLTSCYENKEGCLDILSQNFDALADDPCKDCCTYPNVKIDLKHINGKDSFFTINDTVFNGLKDSFRVIESKFYVSNISVYQKGVATKTVNFLKDSLTGVSLRDDIVFLRPQDKEISVNGYRLSGAIDSVTFDLGLRDSLMKGNFNRVSASHPLNKRNELVNENDNRVFVSLKLVDIKNLKKDTIAIQLMAAPTTYRFTHNNVKSARNGEDVVIKMSANYQYLLRNVDLTKPIGEIEVILRKNLSSFLYVR